MQLRIILGKRALNKGPNGPTVQPVVRPEVKTAFMPWNPFDSFFESVCTSLNTFPNRGARKNSSIPRIYSLTITVFELEHLSPRGIVFGVKSPIELGQ